MINITSTYYNKLSVIDTWHGIFCIRGYGCKMYIFTPWDHGQLALLLLIHQSFEVNKLNVMCRDKLTQVLHDCYDMHN